MAILVQRRSLLGKRTGVFPKQFEEGLGIGLHIEFHLPLFQNLWRPRFIRVRSAGRGCRTSNLASVILCSISKRWSKACGLIIATVREELTSTGVATTSFCSDIERQMVA